MSQTPSRFACDGCGKSFKWKPEIAGRKAKCTCGKTLVVPSEDPAPPDDVPSLDNVEDSYDMKEEPAPARASPKPKPVAKAATPPQRVRPSEKEKMPLNWSAAIWIFLGGAGMIVYAVYLIINPHDPAEDDRYRVRWYKRLLNLLYAIGGHWTAVSVLVALGLLIIGMAYYVLVNKVTDDEAGK